MKDGWLVAHIRHFKCFQFPALVHQPVHPPFHLPVQSPVHMSVRPSIRPYVYLSVSPYVCVSVHTSVCVFPFFLICKFVSLFESWFGILLFYGSDWNFIPSQLHYLHYLDNVNILGAYDNDGKVDEVCWFPKHIVVDLED